MASLPSPTQVSGKHNAIYEAYYKQVDPKGTGTIEALDAAKFLKKSGLSDVVLSRIWDLSDPKGRGCLDKAGLFVSLKLVALAQAGHDLNMRNIFMEPPNPPKVGEIPKIIPQSIQSIPAANTDWSMKPSDRQKYENLFESLQPVNGLIAGAKVKGVLMDSKLPLETLGKIWDLADQDKDGSLDKHEFAVAMHLVYQALDKRAIPASLPPELLKPKPSASPAPSNDAFGDAGFVANFPKDIAPPPVPPLPAVMSNVTPPVNRVPPTVPSVPAVPTMPLIPSDIIPTESVMQPVTTTTDWVVSKEDLGRFEVMFRESDRDKDGLVSGFEVKNVFLQSGVPQNCLAHIWALCDTKECGKLTLEQFALAMWMVERKKNGIEPPEVLTPNMIPPSLRGSIGGETVVQETKPTYSNPELEMISKEIEELAKERRILETDIAQKEADIRIKSGEVRSLQSELDTLTATLKQLENQKGEAQKRLDDLKAQKIEVDDSLASVNLQIDVTRQQVNKIREQCQKQEATINEQETELNSKRCELQKLKDEETALEKEYDANRKELDKLTKQLQDTQLQISQIKAMVTQLLETQRQMNDALLLCKAAIESNDAVLVSDYSLKIEPDFQEAKEMLEKQIEQKTEVEDAFGEKDAFVSDPFNKSNGFTSDPFAGTNGAKATTGFDDNFSSAPISGFDDAFGGGFTSNKTKDPFGSSKADPFDDKKSTAITPEPGKDDFGSDPFAILHAPTGTGQVLSPSAQKSGPPPRPESPSPALPPKKSKQPPPRPAPPRPLQGPTRPSTDGFGSSKGFVDFADFDNKQPPPLPPPPVQPPLVPKSQQQQQPQISSTSTSQQSEIPPIITTTNPTPPVATDFVEDPFKDYRYEDPFSIRDPFADEDDGEPSAEDLFPVDSKADTKITNESNKDDILKLVDNFNMKTTLSNTLNNKLNNNAVTSTTTTTTTETNFADFDAFGMNDNNNSSKTDFFDAFNDNFKSTNEQTITKLNNTVTAFDAFGDMKSTSSLRKTTTLTASSTTNKTSTTLFNTFNDNFEDDFFKSNTTNKFDKNNEEKSNGNFAKFDAFGDDFGADFSNMKNFKNTINDTNNNKQNNKIKKDNSNIPLPNKKNDEKVTQKFADDYSSGDNFNSDLEAVLQRSLVDQ